MTPSRGSFFAMAINFLGNRFGRVDEHPTDHGYQVHPGNRIQRPVPRSVKPCLAMSNHHRAEGTSQVSEHVHGSADDVAMLATRLDANRPGRPHTNRSKARGGSQ